MQVFHSIDQLAATRSYPFRCYPQSRMEVATPQDTTSLLRGATALGYDLVLMWPIARSRLRFREQWVQKLLMRVTRALSNITWSTTSPIAD